MVCYFLLNNLAIGLNPGYRRQKIILTEEERYKVTIIKRFEVTPFIRYYAKINEKLRFFVHSTFVGGEYSSVNVKEEHFDIVRHSVSEEYTLSPRIRFEPGLVFFATKRIAIEAKMGSIGYSFIKSKRKSVVYGGEEIKHSATDN
jgi:hypothetical protein